MKKKISSIVTLLTILFSIVFGGVTGIAVGEKHPSIAPTIGSLTIHKYLYDAEGINDGQSGNGRVPENISELEGKEIKDVQFDVYQVGNATGDNAKNAPEVVPGGSEWTYKLISYDNNKGTMEVSDGTNTYQYEISGKQSGKTGDNGAIVFSKLKGYYFVMENLAESEPKMKDEGGNWNKVAITSPIRPFVVAVPMTDPDDLNKWITDVHVYPKNQSSDIVKEPSKPSVNVGEEFSWLIAVELPEDITDYKKFIVIDKLDEALTYKGNVKVYQAEKVDGKWQKVESGGELVAETEYKVTEPASPDNKLEVALTKPDGFTKVDGWEGLIVEFNTEVNEKIEDKDVNIIGNKATVEFTNSQDQDSDKETDESEVNVGDITVDKRNENDEKLPEAEFQIADSLENATNGKFIKVVTNDSGEITKIVYPDNKDYGTAKNWIVKPYSENDPNFFDRFTGLETFSVEKNNHKSYWLVETKAPKDYNLLGDPVEVNFKDSEEVEGKKTYNLTTDPIVNKKGFILPNTGGIGTMLLVIVGIVLVGLAIILNMNNKKKKA
ncbi:SpaH/EbpB family LPXTG-anchored major pilin [Enterococcus devriesei]|uniref:SpaH/EbpB family LPXTG-anchored major pilin n=1 Tax=Enterococcus devriesei TaxID=319970 RepID=UPI0028ADA748|nr:SpaH/EbpB family LPXTG-anchored major pilin [Enterococcus devriesei]